MRKTLAYISILLMAAVLGVSCKKDKDTTLPTMVGSPTFQMVTFAAMNEEITVSPHGIRHPDGKGIGYAWKVSALSSRPDTVKFEDEKIDSSYTFTTPDEPVTTTVTCYAFADGYQSSYYSRTLMVVDPRFGFTLTDNGIFNSHPSFYDGREQDVPAYLRKYYYVNHDGLDWFRNNLSYTKTGKAYEDSEVMNYIFGRYYNWHEAMESCPEGWRLPTSAEWEKLAGGQLEGVAGSLMVNAQFNDDDMWEYWPEVNITNSLNFCAIPTGYAFLGGEGGKDDYAGINHYAVFWCSDVNPDNPGQARYYYLNDQKPDLFRAWADKDSFGASVRCVRKNEDGSPVSPLHM